LREHVLVVDDEQAICEIVSSMLRRAGFTCRAAGGGKEALATLDSGEEFDVAVVNLMMPDLDGLQLIERMAVARPGLPVFLETGNYGEGLVLECLRHGAYDYLLKPFTDRQLVAHVRRVIKLGSSKVFGDSSESRFAQLTSARSQELRERIRSFDLFDADPVEMVFLDDQPDHLRCDWALGSVAIAIARAAGLSKEEIYPIARATLLHGIGQHPSLPHLLLHPEILQADELAVACQLSHDVRDMLQSVSFLVEASEILYACAERFDGSGYPRGLRAGQIPLGARIFALAYTVRTLPGSIHRERERRPMASTHAELQQCSGAHLDPELVRLFLTMPEEIWKDLGNKPPWLH